MHKLSTSSRQASVILYQMLRYTKFLIISMDCPRKDLCHPELTIGTTEIDHQQLLIFKITNTLEFFSSSDPSTWNGLEG